MRKDLVWMGLSAARLLSAEVVGCSGPQGQSVASSEASVNADAGLDAAEAGAPDGSPDATSDSSSMEDAGGVPAYADIILNNVGCFPENLPKQGSMVACRVLLVGVSGGCGQAGLSPAPAADVSAIDAEYQAHNQPPPSGAVCQLDQMGEAASAVGCADGGATGWCFAAHGCVADAGATCMAAGALCTTQAFVAANVSYVVSVLECP